MQKSLRQKDDGTYFVGQYELTVRQSDDVAVAAGNGKGIGLTKANGLQNMDQTEQKLDR